MAALVTVREVDTDGELEQAAILRAEAYYEDQLHNRFVDSFKRQFKEQVRVPFNQCVCGAAVRQLTVSKKTRLCRVSRSTLQGVLARPLTRTSPEGRTS
jgi:hypothetical protein